LPLHRPSFHLRAVALCLVFSFALLPVTICPTHAQDTGEAAVPAEAGPKPKAKPKPAPAAKSAPVAKPVPVVAPTTQAATWPVGASSVSEVYGDWTVVCARENSGPATCTLMQAQGSKTDGRRSFAIELRTPTEGRAAGLILMPLGLNIEGGVQFKLDDAVLGQGAPFLSCSQEGCMVPVSFPTLATDTMKTAKALTITATRPDAKEPLVVTVPLGGFGPALSRALALVG
jgi:invasion protein IalB